MPRKSIDGVRINTYLSKPQDLKLRELAKQTNISYSELIRKAIDLYIKALEIKMAPKREPKKDSYSLKEAIDVAKDSIDTRPDWFTRC